MSIEEIKKMAAEALHKLDNDFKETLKVSKTELQEILGESYQTMIIPYVVKMEFLMKEKNLDALAALRYCSENFLFSRITTVFMTVATAEILEREEDGNTRESQEGKEATGEA